MVPMYYFRWMKNEDLILSKHPNENGEERDENLDNIGSGIHQK